MSEPRFRSDIVVRLVQRVGSDAMIAAAARVSVTGADGLQGEGGNPVTDANAGLIRYLMKHRHASPFEHGQLTFYAECPIFVAREWMRHRTWSFNETSGRYRVLEPVFWVPPEGRAVVEPPAFKPSRPVLVESEQVRESVVQFCQHSYYAAWWNYQAMIADGVAREVARSVLPVGTYTSFYATVNPRNLMGFLSLRTHDASATNLSYPQAEIEDAARQMEEVFKGLFPLTYAAFVGNGRVAP